MNEVEQTLRLMWVIGKCVEDCDCQIWSGSSNGLGHPKTKDGSARRLVWEAHKYELKASQLVTVTCGRPECLNPAHLKVTSKSEVSRKSNARYTVKLLRSASSAATNRPKFGKITMDIAREIRDSEREGKQWAQDLGVSPSLISKVRQNKSWVDHRNPFLGLMA